MRSAGTPAARRASRSSYSILPDRRPSVGRGFPRPEIRKEGGGVKRGLGLASSIATHSVRANTDPENSRGLELKAAAESYGVQVDVCAFDVRELNKFIFPAYEQIRHHQDVHAEARGITERERAGLALRPSCGQQIERIDDDTTGPISHRRGYGRRARDVSAGNRKPSETIGHETTSGPSAARPQGAETG